MSNAPRRGFASLMVVAAMPLVATALLALAIFAAADARRTTAAGQTAQVRQLLLAGGASVVDRAAEWKETAPVASYEVAVPISLAAEQARVRVAIVPDGQAAVAQVEASYAGQLGRQTLRLVRISDRWRVERATLDGER